MGHAKKNCIFLHCLPRGNEVTDDIFLGKKSHVWQQALNRVHVEEASIQFDPTTNVPEVSMGMNSEGARVWSRITGANIGKPIINHDKSS